MRDDRKRFAIMKGINYKDASADKWKRHIEYIFSTQRTSQEFKKAWFLDLEKPLEGIARLYARYHPQGKRAFKHWIVSFGAPDISADTAFGVSQEIAAYFAKEYPLLLSLHTNLPQRLHCHFLQSTVNIRTGKKFSQSPADFQGFRRYINGILDTHGLPLLRGIALKRAEEAKGLDDMEHPFEHTNRATFYPSAAWLNDRMYTPIEGLRSTERVSPGVDVQGDFNRPKCLDVLNQSFTKFYEFGRGKNHEP